MDACAFVCVDMCVYAQPLLLAYVCTHPLLCVQSPTACRHAHILYHLLACVCIHNHLLYVFITPIMCTHASAPTLCECVYFSVWCIPLPTPCAWTWCKSTTVYNQCVCLHSPLFCDKALSPCVWCMGVLPHTKSPTGHVCMCMSGEEDMGVYQQNSLQCVCMGAGRLSPLPQCTQTSAHTHCCPLLSRPGDFNLWSVDP